MLYIEWKSTYGIGHKEIDKQHQKLVNMINHLLRSLSDGPVNREVGAVLTELVNYTKYHFQTEENLMAQIGYPDLNRHQGLHKSLVQQVVNILTDLKENKEVTALQLIDLLKRWLVDHILQEDKQIGEFLSAQGRLAAKSAR